MDHEISCPWLLLFDAPGFIQVGYHYFFSSRVLRSLIYTYQKYRWSKTCCCICNRGAWIIGYKAWGSLLGQQLSERDIMGPYVYNFCAYLASSVDFSSLFDWDTIGNMVEDASEGISFVCNKIADYGGDLTGNQEAGEGESTTWSVSQIKAYFGLSGGYNLFKLVDYFHSRCIMEGEESLRRFSPEVIVQDPNLKNAVSLLPPIVLFHGTADYSIPADSSKTFSETLQSVGLELNQFLYEGKTHTDLFLQVKGVVRCFCLLFIRVLD
ncbi:hypothetical protein OIU76_011781 [Salix suchowensis]|nr:hypothetical protein OIU76_011781 [Salix suchowensis]